MATVNELTSQALAGFLQQYASIFNVENVVPVYENGQVKKIDEYIKGEIVHSVALSYNSLGVLISYTETVANQSVTYNINYQNGEFSSVTKAS